jgi:hypothetical protein
MQDGTKGGSGLMDDQSAESMEGGKKPATYLKDASSTVQTLSAQVSALPSVRFPVNLIGSPINCANRLIGSPITSQSTGSGACQFPVTPTQYERWSLGGRDR